MVTKTQVDRLGERLRVGNISDDDLKLLDSYRRSFAPAYEMVITVIRDTIDFEPTGRPAKSTTSIVEKLRRETIRLTQMQDVAGCRLVVPNMLAQNTVVRRLRRKLPGSVTVDRRRRPSHGYRAVHVIATANSKPIEIQVRTTLQHLWAEYSEKLADIVDPAIKYGGGEPAWRDILDQFSKLVAGVEALEIQRSTPERRKELRSIKQQLRRVLKNATVDASKPVSGKQQ